MPWAASPVGKGDSERHLGLSKALPGSSFRTACPARASYTLLLRAPLTFTIWPMRHGLAYGARGRRLSTSKRFTRAFETAGLQVCVVSVAGGYPWGGGQ